MQPRHNSREMSCGQALHPRGGDCIGGTWDLFRYPGIRSDSDMYTMGYDSKPWPEPKTIADGPSILSYIKEAAAEKKIDDIIKYRHKVESASWDSKNNLWEISLKNTRRDGFANYEFPFHLQRIL